MTWRAPGPQVKAAPASTLYRGTRGPTELRCLRLPSLSASGRRCRATPTGPAELQVLGESFDDDVASDRIQGLTPMLRVRDSNWTVCVALGVSGTGWPRLMNGQTGFAVSQARTYGPFDSLRAGTSAPDKSNVACHTEAWAVSRRRSDRGC